MPVARSEPTRARILVAARALLAEGGATAFSMRAVAQRAGVSLSNLQFHHATAEALLEAVLDDELARGRALVEAAVAEALADDAAAVSIVEVALDALLAQQRDVDSMRLFLALWSFAARHDNLQRALAAFYARFVDDIVAVLGAGDGEVDGEDDDDPARKTRSRVAVALLEGASLFRSGVAGALNDAEDALLRRTLLGLLVPAKSAAR